ncbi:protein transport protein Sec16B [Thomomys bottae]
MEPWVPQWPIWLRGRPMASSRDPDRGLWRPPPNPQHSGERFNQWQDIQENPQPWQEPRADHQQSHYPSRRGEWPQPMSAGDYYEGGYHMYSRPGYEDIYQRYHSSTLREDYAYGSYYYQGQLQRLQEERVPRQGSPYVWHEDYGNQKHLSEHGENRTSPFGTNNETKFQSLSQNPYKDSPTSSSGQEQPGDLRNKLSEESNLLQQHESGLSSSTYELSQYMADVPEQSDPRASSVWHPIQDGNISAAEPKALLKFYVPHVAVSFGPGGQLVCVSPNNPLDGQTAIVELHSMEVILNDSEDQEEMRSFSGPLIREDVHKVDIMTFCQHKAAQSHKSEIPQSRDSALLWQLLVLLCRQNGSMVGSDIAELLMQDCKKLEKYKRQAPVANLINLTDEDWPVRSSGNRNLLTGEIPPTVETPAQVVEKFTTLLFYGRKKEALEWAMKNHLWGHALFLSSKMDPRTYNWVMSGFTTTLALNDPLQTLFQLMSGRIPQAATCCGDKQWGDWRPHLAVILSNQAGDLELYQRAIVTMGDTLAGKGLVEASHFCYLMAHVPFGHYPVKTDHLVLLGRSHSQEFLKFATTEAIQRTEIFEYCQMLGRPKSFIPSFQVYKLLYASRLADYGLVSQALHYCEAIGAAVLSQAESSHPVLLVELIKLADKLKLSDPLVLERHRGDRELEPEWLVQLRKLHKDLEQKVAGDIGDPPPAHSDVSEARRTSTGTHNHELELRIKLQERKMPAVFKFYILGLTSSLSFVLDTFFQDLSSEDPGYGSAQQSTPGQIGPNLSIPQQPFSLQQDPYPGGGHPGHPGTPVPLYAVPETPFSGIGTGGGSSMAVTGAPAGRAWEETLQIQPRPGAITASQENYQDLNGQRVIPEPQALPAPRARRFSESSTVSAKENEESSDKADKKSSQNAAQREKPGDVKENTKSSGFGWLSWFRGKPSGETHSEDEDSSHSSDSEESLKASSAQPASLRLSPTPPLEPPPLPGTGRIGGGDVPESMYAGGAAKGFGAGDFSALEGVSSELYSTPPLKGAVPLYNPAHVPQLSPATRLNRPNRLAQRRYPTQPC